MKIALYARVSSDEQAERNTIQNQLDYLRDRCRLDKFEIAGEYVDDGVSGTVPLPQRRDGRLLLTDARNGEFEAVLVTKVDRLARSLRVLLDTHIALSAFGISIKSATEPLDTGSTFGVFLFQLLGSMAELERNTILERTAIGRARIAKAGRWTGGRAPFGYALVDGCLVEHPENAAVVRDIWTRVANGATLQQEARERGWRASKLSRMLNSTVYLGELRLKSTVLSVPPLISPELWAKAHAVLKANLSRNVSKRRVNVL
jgi:DNA invertase Pin-like site-specific DNA recombinase